MKEFHTNDTGMSYARARDIESARARGDVVDLSAEDEKQLKSILTARTKAEASMKNRRTTGAVLAEVQRNLNRMTSPMSAAIDDPDASARRDLPVKLMSGSGRTMSNAQLKRELENSENLKATAGALQGVAAILASQKEAADIRDAAATREAKKNWRVTLATLIVTCLGFALAIGTEVIKVWQ